MIGRTVWRVVPRTIRARRKRAPRLVADQVRCIRFALPVGGRLLCDRKAANLAGLDGDSASETRSQLTAEQIAGIQRQESAGCDGSRAGVGCCSLDRSGRPMRYILALMVCLVAWGGETPTGTARAQDQQIVPIEIASDRVSSVFNSSDPASHAGLLGKIYIQDRYRQQSVDDPGLRQIDKSWQGFDTLVNLPAITLDTSTPLDVDVFFGYANVGLKGTRSTGAPFNISSTLNAKTEGYSVGTSIYLSQSAQWRPFVQVGARFARYDNDVILDGGLLGTFARNSVSHDTRLLLNTGFEFDIMDSLAFRSTLFAETKDRFQNSVISHDLILWPVDRIFIRGGVSSALDGNRFGFSIGGGLAF